MICSSCGERLSRKRKSGMCKSCYLASCTGSANPNWKGDEACKEAFHMRVKYTRGYASQYKCVDCFEPAKEWSHLHNTDPGDPVSYMPRCYQCHRDYDHDIIHSKESRKRNSEAHKKPWSRERHFKQTEQASELWLYRKGNPRNIGNPND